MSADNFIGIYHHSDNCFYVADCSASADDRDNARSCVERGEKVATEEEAYAVAHRIEGESSIVEYGVSVINIGMNEYELIEQLMRRVDSLKKGLEWYRGVTRKAKVNAGPDEDVDIAQVFLDSDEKILAEKWEVVLEEESDTATE